MAALLIDAGPNDEIILPSYTYVSTANAFALRGAHLKFVDSNSTHPNMDVSQVAALITERTKAIVVMHYGGMACAMDEIMALAKQHDLLVIEDAAQAIDGWYKEQRTGTIGHLAAMSFHETKNVHCGEGGMLMINDERFMQRAERIREKGTNRPDFFRKEVEKYSWVDIGSSYLPSDILAAMLYGQLIHIDRIQKRRTAIFERYNSLLSELPSRYGVELTHVPEQSRANGHLFYLVCKSEEERSELIRFLDERQVKAVFHYQALHDSPYYKEKYNGAPLPHSLRFTNCLLRLPFYYELEDEEIEHICNLVHAFYSK
jgi:dTDP-4-amino-4,6-dideoxygalactose transaminase